jgi:hypothetical protein
VFDVSLLADLSGYVVVGYSESTDTSRRSVGVAMANSAGKQLWSRTYGVRRLVKDLKAIRTRDGGLLVWGRQAEPTIPYLLRISATGESLWTRTYGRWGRQLDAVVRTADGGFVLTGTDDEAPTYLLKVNAWGDTLWFKSYRIGHGLHPHSVQQTADGGYILTGVASGDAYVVRTDSVGNMLWSRSWGSARSFDYDEGWSVRQTKDGGFVVLAWFEGPKPGPGMYLVRTNGKGDRLWMHTYGPRVGFWDVRQTADGGFIMAGWKARHPSDDGIHVIGDQEICVVRTDARGDTLWTRTLDDTFNEQSWSAFKTKNDGLAIAWVVIPRRPELFGLSHSSTTDSGDMSIQMILVDAHGNVFRP